jgi:hypothetical protein
MHGRSAHDRRRKHQSFTKSSIRGVLGDALPAMRLSSANMPAFS